MENTLYYTKKGYSMSSNRNNKGRNPNPGRSYRILGTIVLIGGFIVVMLFSVVIFIIEIAFSVDLDPEERLTFVIITFLGLFLVISGSICTGIGKIMNMVNPYKIDDEEDEQTNEK